MTAFALLFTICAIGISETSYLIKKRIALEKPICIIGQDCAQVLSSAYNKIFFGIPNDILGLLFYIMGAGITAFLVIGIQPMWFWSMLFKIMIILGSLLSLFFIYLQWKVIKAWCFWCVMSACTIWLMGIIILIRNI